MKVLPLLIVLFVLSTSILGKVPQPGGAFTKKVITVKGDLNKDGLDDMATVTQDTTNPVWPYRVEVFLAQQQGGYILAVTADKAIEPQYPNGKYGYVTGNSFGDIAIDNGVLSINADLLRGHYVHKFRYQNGSFELIGYSETDSDGKGVCSEVDFNLSTGIRIVKSERCDIDKKLTNTKKKILIRPLPKLDNFQPMENSLY